MSSNITLTKSGQTSVIIHTIGVKENWVNAFESFNLPRAQYNYAEGYKKYILNFITLTRQFEITGYIHTDQGTDVSTLRTRIITLIKAGGTVSFSYGGETITGCFGGLEFREVPADSATVKYFLVNVSIIEGDLV